ncbi:hypothetical protein A3J20_05565 [Candidatus Gottesmanbacteria bacterium RIFCSPLOWO2_02_FULL_42_29]|uniref:AAA+ ATPase domain-containing protein n=2 Tax=Candidatus Gottesmaniibacteriota TaxID=1752720 RepID=A0A1F6BK43_9BACT|nr:MAG: hypothetical protein UV09_C0008G0039 [Candidatus Gottesmanbacteria bacterium GW2011_GWA2_42_18]KKS74684.1 MAG: hypothetical protein UV46_C0037G0003 [Candidatus Gottesmanbacteria bacterium GW2011_GWC2_42_8]OGG10711.1 MAG: hypothetical protein A2781_07320 [Candidatus Gottesmanbacteria bacterium RIFCSPHIGHO2_01_FULL_42_27]OGG20147.1 MAG: hypothetical protein A3E72_01155 [Candidatus Gottesmanbacteria bacterium RIFCSPHIGHO2_12_FULL_43_26]OGG34314.1 MAG: hypothetical protein A3G68_05085 [Cand
MPGKNKHLLRYLEPKIRQLLTKKFSGLILGPRQVGKTTLVRDLLEKFDNKIEIFLQNPKVRLETEVDPSAIIRQVKASRIKPLVFVDEAQKVPEIFDSAQFLIDEGSAQFIFTGSSARKLKRSKVNLLPGRIKRFHLDPLLWGELGWIKKSSLGDLTLKNINRKTGYTFEDSLIFGSLPLIISLSDEDKRDIIKSYAEIYIEEEIRAEAISRKIGAFSRFLELAARESGTSPNFSKLSNESGVSQPAVKEFYRILEDTLIAERVDPYLKNARKRILSMSRYYFFDLGVRNSLAKIPLEKNTIHAQKGVLFEHAVILEIIRRIKVLNKNYKVCFWRTAGGAEVDCIIDRGSSVIPIEIKSSKYISASEIKGLKIFLNDYRKLASHGYVITMGEKPERVSDNITAIPWFYL